MPAEPPVKRTVAFFDGQNLYHVAKLAFGYTYPNYDPLKLAADICKQEGWRLSQVRFYTGVPDRADNAFWHHFWTAKTAQMGRQGVKVYTRALRYRNKTIELPDGSKHVYRDGDEKGIDVRLAVDVISLGHRTEYDVALIFSQDQDLSEVSDEVRVISQEQNRWIKVASAYPTAPGYTNRRGIMRTQWLPISQAVYDQCLDPRDYRPKQK